MIIRLAVGALALAVALALTGCGDDRASQQAGLLRPGAYHPEQFPDIPLPPGFVLREDADQLAIAMAGGAVRRFEVAMEERSDGKRQRPAEVLAWYDRVLATAGWASGPAAGGQERTWTKSTPAGGGEALTIVVSGGARTRLDLRLRPSASDPAAP